MIIRHTPAESGIDIHSAIDRHSADIVVAYKHVASKPVFLGYYLPPAYTAGQTYPAFLFVHGGGWGSHMIFPDQDTWAGDYLGYLARYYADKGFVCISIDYRLAQNVGQKANYTLIDCYEDCCDAVDYIIANADKYGVDPACMQLLGESAGGHLAGALATFHYDRKYTFQNVFLVNPITHFSDRWKAFVPADSQHPQLVNLSPDERAVFLSPLHQLHPNCGQIRLFHGLSDESVNIEHSYLFYEKMLSLGIPCELHSFEDTTHAFLLAEYYPNGLAACETTIDIINRILGI